MKGAGTYLKTSINEMGGTMVEGNCNLCNMWPCEHSFQDEMGNWLIKSDKVVKQVNTRLETHGYLRHYAISLFWAYVGLVIIGFLSYIVLNIFY